MKTINADRELMKLGRRLNANGREVLALLLMAGDENVLRAAVGQLAPARAAELAGAFATLATLPDFEKMPGLLPRVRTVTAALNEVAPAPGLAAFDLGGLLSAGGNALGGLAQGGGVIGDVLGGLGGVFNVLGGPALSPIVGIVGNVIGAAIGGNEPNLPQHDYNASNQQALAAAAARTLWAQQAAQQQQQQQQAQGAQSKDSTVPILIGAALIGAAIVGSSRSRRR